MPRVRPLARHVSPRVAAGARWMSANGHTVLGQGCLGPITIARADTQQCAFLTSDSPWIASRVISLSLLFSTTRLSLSLSPFRSSSRLPSLSLARFTWALSQAPTNELGGSDGPLPLPRWSRGGSRSPLRDNPLSRLSPFLAGRAFLESFVPPREATFGFDLWIPWHRHRDDQSSNYGRNPHVSPRVPSRPRVFVSRMILQSNTVRISSKVTHYFRPHLVVIRALRNLPRQREKERGKWNWMTTEIGAPLRRSSYAD